MCQDIQQVSFSCGHQTKFWWFESRFCLFTDEEADRFHTTYLFYSHSGNKCPRCKIGQQIKGQGKVMKRGDFQQQIEEWYVKTVDFAQEENAKKFEAEANEARRNLTGDRRAELKRQIKERIAFYLDEDETEPSVKVVLLSTILGLPDIFDRKELVALFAHLYFKKSDTERKLEGWEKNKLFSAARKAGFERTLKANLKFRGLAKQPREQKAAAPAPTSAAEGEESLTSAPELKSAQQQAEEGVAQLSLAP
ncbi:hypothetical protein RRF57_011076 [Xylaria bambusicola]|uniref:Uncharacterized protein n=1 Tax=Xylaria bambusicola TaxID=326684 RepID=A0AAN7UW10_9PEZI